MNGELEGRVALVAGAGRGIGRAVAHLYAEAGARLVLASRTQADLDRVAAECLGRGAPAARGVTADVADWRAVSRLVAEAVAGEGRIDVLVISSGIYGPIAPIADVDVEAWARALQVNLAGPFYLLRAVLPLMRAQRAGRVILLGGGGATQPMAGFSAYAAAKAGLVRLAETAADEARDAGVQVNVIAPGLVDTGLQDAVIEAGRTAGAIGERIRLARETGQGAVGPELAAALALFLASDASAGLTGKLISAPYDPWREWTGDRAHALSASDWFTLRRLDPHTIGRLPGDLA